jgi:hypothetical protein
MKKTSARKTHRASLAGDLRPEYRFDYTRARPNRFATEMGGGHVAVVLDPDVASVFNTSESVNTLLRSVIAAVPASKARTKKRVRAS